MVFELGPYKVDVDVARTKAFYQNALYASEQCPCDGCQNYVRAVDTFPKAVLMFFASLGIDPKKPSEVWVNNPDHNGLLLYHGFYHLCGTILSDTSAYRPIGENASYWDNTLVFHIIPELRISFEKKCDLLEKGFPLPAIQMEIDTEIPWILKKDKHDISFDWR